MRYHPQLSRWYALFSAGKMVEGAICRFPKSEQEFLLKFKVQSILLAPLFVEEELWGFVGFGYCRSEREWSDNIRSLLKTVVSSLSASIVRRRTEEQLRIAKEAAEDAARTKSEFLANMSHEIRTPMNAVIGMTDLLRNSDLTAAQENFVETIQNSGNGLLNIIDDILDFSKIESGKLILTSGIFDLSLCIEEVFDLFALEVSQKSVEISYVIHPDIPDEIGGDSMRLRQILVNLIGNAVRFTHTGSISVSVDYLTITKQNLLHFCVRDTGIGIPADQLARLFDSFTQVDSSTTRRYGGTGLGLTISKRLCHLMGGSMWVESQVNVGSSFHFTLQLKTDHIDPNKALDTTLANKRILIIDHNDTRRKHLTNLVKSWGMQSTILTSIAELESIVQSNQDLDTTIKQTAEHYDLALYNIVSLESNGLGAAEKIRQILDNPKLPFILLTFLLDIEDREKSTACPFITYLTKPMKRKQLLLAMAGLLNITLPQKQIRSNGHQLEPWTDKTSLSILLAEDNLTNQKVALLMLEKLGYQATAVATGFEVIQALQANAYDVILMDVQMPEMDGLAATRHIRTQFDVDEQPYIVAITANAMSDDKELCLQAGMDAYLSKPMRMQDLQNVLRQVIPNGQSST